MIDKFKKGQKVKLKNFKHREDLILTVVLVYLAGSEHSKFLMVHAMIGNNPNACVFAPQEYFENYEEKNSIEKMIDPLSLLTEE